jgi:hypothetical protein
MPMPTVKHSRFTPTPSRCFAAALEMAHDSRPVEMEIVERDRLAADANLGDIGKKAHPCRGIRRGGIDVGVR